MPDCRLEKFGYFEGWIRFVEVDSAALARTIVSGPEWPGGGIEASMAACEGGLGQGSKLIASGDKSLIKSSLQTISWLVLKKSCVF